jgi:hypothetical protein
MAQRQEHLEQHLPQQDDEDARHGCDAPYNSGVSNSTYSRSNLHSPGNGLASFSAVSSELCMTTAPTNNLHQRRDLSDDLVDFFGNDGFESVPLSRQAPLLPSSPDRTLSLPCCRSNSDDSSSGLSVNPVLCRTSDPLYNLLNFDPTELFGGVYKPDTKPFLQTPRVLSDREKWHSTDDVYKSAITAYRNISRGRNSGLSSTPFVAIIQGWDMLDENDRTHPIWASLHWVQESVFGSWQTNAQRIALMYLKHRLMMVRRRVWVS